MAEVNKTEEISLDESLCKDVLIATLELKTFEQEIAEANRRIQDEFAKLRQHREEALDALVASTGMEKEAFLNEYDINLKSAKARRRG
jgi:hypothetical protein